MSPKIKLGIKGGLKATLGDTVLFIKAKFSCSKKNSRLYVKYSTNKTNFKKLLYDIVSMEDGFSV